MKKEHISDALNMLNDDIIEETNNVRTNAKPTRKWVKWGVVAACLCLAVTIAIPMLHHKGGPDTQDPVQNIAALEYNGKFYEAVKLPEVLEKYGLPPEITADMAGEHISYLKSDGGIGYKSTVSQTDIELYRYAPAVCDGVYVLRDGDTWYAALFCNFYQFDSNTNCSFTELYRVYGIESADDIASITEMKWNNEQEVGSPVTNRQEITEFYRMTITLVSYGNDDLMVSPKKINRKRTLLLPMIEEISESKPPLACASLSPSIRTMTGLRAEAQCPISKLITRCTDGLREI